MNLNDQNLRSMLEEAGMPAAQIDEFFADMDRLEEGGGPKAGPVPGVDGVDIALASLEEAAMAETDWRKKAALRAAIISHKLEHDIY